MKINIESYNKDWPVQFRKLKKEILILLKEFDPVIEHFGSTAVPGLSAKPVIDILVGIENTHCFSQIVELILQHKSYLYYQVFDNEIANRRLFVRLKDDVDYSEFDNVLAEFETIPHDKINQARIAHIHIWEYNSPDWIRHVAFRDYLLSHDVVRKKYGTLKKGLGEKEWKHGMEYNDQKNAFIKIEEAKAIAWYHSQNDI